MSHKTQLRIALLSDTHGVVDPRVAELIEGSDWIVHAGDIGNAGVLHQLARLGDAVVAVRGNNDTPLRWPQEDHQILADLPYERSIELPAGKLVVLHGHRINPASQRHSRLRQRYPEVRVVVYGHSHRLVQDTDEGPWILNPGAAGHARTYGGPSCMMLQIHMGQWHIEHHRFIQRNDTRNKPRGR